MASHYETSVQGMLERMSSSDKDFRFMATTDLMTVLQKEVVWDDESEERITRKILLLLQDKTLEVQNLAVKCLKYLVDKIKTERIELVINELCTMIESSSEQTRDTALVALKSIASELPVSNKVVKILEIVLIPKLLAAISHHSDLNVKLECLDVLIELIDLFSTQIGPFHKPISDLLFEQLTSNRLPIRKRSTLAQAQLMICCSAELFSETIEKLTQLLNSGDPSMLHCLSHVLKVSGHRLNQEQVDQILAEVAKYSEIDDDEIREHFLQTFHALVSRAPALVKRYLPDIIMVCLKNLTHDPNYNYEEGEDENEEMEMDGSDQSSDSSDDYSDEDDISWKVRRASAKCLEAIIITRPELTVEFYSTIAPTLIQRFKEREENVKSDIIQTFIALIKQTRNQEILCQLVPSIVQKASNLLREKSVKTRQNVFQLFTEIMLKVFDAFSTNISLLIPGILYSLAEKNSTSSMKIAALNFIRTLMDTHQPHILYPHMHIILPAVTSSIKDSFYKVASEALSLLTQVMTILRPSSNNGTTQECIPLVEGIYERTLECMSKKDIDLEIKERSIACLGHIIATFGDHMSNVLFVALPMLVEKLDVETTRLTAVKSLITITNSPLDLDLSLIFPKAFQLLAPFLKKNNRPLKLNTLILIESIVRRAPQLIDEQNIESILNETSTLIVEEDLYLSQLTLKMMATLVKTHKAFSSQLPQTILPQSLQLIRSPLLQGPALSAMLDFLSTLVQHNFPGLEHYVILTKLLEPIYRDICLHKQAYYSTAKAISIISIHNAEIALKTVKQLVTDIEKHPSNDCVQMLILLSIAEIGRKVNLASIEGLLSTIFETFSSCNEDVKLAGSYALGSVTIGNLNGFLPLLLIEIEARDKRRYLLLHSMREILSSEQVSSVIMNQYLETIWELLMKQCDCSEEGTKNVASECLGTLTLSKPEELLPRLVSILNGEFAKSPVARTTLLMAIKYTILDKPHSIDEPLKLYFPQFLAYIQDDDINVRRVALLTFNSAAHYKPSLIRDLLPQFLPLLYEETRIKQHLMRQVQMGPFKHEVDDGLECRETAYECMYTLLETCLGHIDIYEFLSYVQNGMNDHNDIKMLSYLMVTRLCALHPSAVLGRIDRLLTPIESICRSSVKENAVKQEKDLLDELKRSALRAFDAISHIPDANKHPVVLRFKNFVVVDKELSGIYKSVHNDNTQASGGGDASAHNKIDVYC